MPSARRVMCEPLDGRLLWAATFPQSFGGGGFDNAERVVQTRAGGLVVTGLFSGTANFARPGERQRLLTARGDSDVYVASYAPDGGLSWAVRVGGDYESREMRDFDRRDVQINQRRFSRYLGRVGAQPRLAGEYVNDIAADDSGNVFLAGAFRDTLRAGGFRLTADQDVTGSYYDALVLKISAGGAVTWAKRIGGSFDDDALTIGVDRTGSPTVGGYVSRGADFDDSDDESDRDDLDGRDAGFVLRLTPEGDFGWAYRVESDAIGTDERDSVNDLAVTRGGEVYLAGSFAADVDFLPGRAEEDIRDSEGKTDAFVAKLSRKGAFVWAQTTGGDDYDANVAIAIDPTSGDVFTAGYFSDEDVDVDPRPDVTTLLTPLSEDDDEGNPEFSDLLVSKFDANGTPLWQSQIGGGYVEVVGDLRVDGTGGVFLTGSYFNEIDLAPGRGVFRLESVRTNDGSIKDRNTDFGRNESYDWFAVRLSNERGKFVAGAGIGRADDDYNGGLTPLADGTLLFYGRIVDSGVPDRGDRQEQAWIYQVSPNLKLL